MKKRVIAYILLSSLIFSTMEVALKVGGAKLDPFQITFLRFLIGGLFLLPFSIRNLKRRGVTLRVGDFAYLALLGFLCVCLSMIFFQLGVLGSNASTAAVIFCTNPLFIMVFAHFVASERFTRRKAVALAVSLVGLASILNPAYATSANTLGGMLCSFLAAVFFGLYSAVGRRRVIRLGGLTQTSISALFGAGFLFIVLLVLDKPVVAGLEEMNPFIFLYIGIVVTGAGYLFHSMAMEASNASTAALVFFFKPVFAPVIAVIILKEQLTVNVYIGIILILIASAISMNLYHNIKKRKEGLQG